MSANPAPIIAGSERSRPNRSIERPETYLASPVTVEVDFENLTVEVSQGGEVLARDQARPGTNRLVIEVRPICSIVDPPPEPVRP